MSTASPAKTTSKRLLYALLGAVAAVGTTFLLAVIIVASAWAAKSAGLTADDFVGILAIVGLACGGGMLGWMYAKSREP